MTHARRRFTWLALGILLLAATSAQADTITIAHFTVTDIWGGDGVDDQETFLQGDPDRYFSMAIFDSSSSSVLNACADGCIVDDADPSTQDGLTFASMTVNTGTGYYNIPDTTLTKVLAGPGAFFYFGLWDADNDADDALGDHWFFASSATSAVELSNNNSSPYYADHPIATINGKDVEGNGNANNFRFSFEVTFEQVPEPSSVILAALGLVGLAAWGWRRKR